MKGVIVHFPWGAAGNFVRNIITIDPRFDFFDDREFRGAYPTAGSRFVWFIEYYKRTMTPDQWLDREWSIRKRLHTCYYTNNCIQYWNPDSIVAYDCHGEQREVGEILKAKPLRCYDQHRIATGEREEHNSDWTLPQCDHVFLLPTNTNLISEIYNSKNPAINQLKGTLQEKQSAALATINAMTSRLATLADTLDAEGQHTMRYNADALYTAAGADIIYDIVMNLSLEVSRKQINALHSIWLQSTKEVYYNYFNRELTT
jgi:hypothetical protein